MRLALIRQRYNPYGGAGRLMALYASLAPSRARRPA